MNQGIHLRRLAGHLERTSARVVAEAKRHADQSGSIAPDALVGLRVPWFVVRNADDGITPTTDTAADDPTTIFIFDEIGGSLGVQASELVDQIEAITAPTIKVRINSPGGSVFDAVAIYNALNHHPAHVVTYVDALAASAATIIAMAGDEIVVMPGGQMMIHDASAMLDGNEQEHTQMGAFLGRQSDNIADIYHRSARKRPDNAKTVDDWRNLMLDETWLFADEAVAIGLADRVGDVVPTDDDAPDEHMQRSHDLSRFRYAGRRNAPEPGSRAHTHRATTTPREQDTRSAAAAARKRHFESGAKVVMPDDQTRRSQTRGQALGLGDSRTLPFGAQVRGSLDSFNGRDMYHVHGYATVYDKPYPMWDVFGEYDEVVCRGAGDRTLMSNPDVSFLVNHGGVTMARTTNGTLSLSSDMQGLVTDAWLNPGRNDVHDLMLAIDDELITEMSFAFMISSEGGHWNDDFTRFEIRQYDIDRGDVSAVNYGANPWTTIAHRAREVVAHAELLPAGMQRALADALGSTYTRQKRRAAAADLAPGLDTRALTTPPTPVPSPILKNQGRTVSLVESMLGD